MMTSTVTSEGERMIGEDQIMNDVISDIESLTEEHQIKEETFKEEIIPSNFEETTPTPLICTCTSAPSICTCTYTHLKCICKMENEEMTGKLLQQLEDETAGNLLQAATDNPPEIPFKCICKCEDEGIADTNNMVVEQQIEKEKIINDNNPPTHQTTIDIPLHSVVLRRLTEDEIMRWSSREKKNLHLNESQDKAAQTRVLRNRHRDIAPRLNHTVIVPKPYACHICQVRAVTPADLKRHLMIHNGEKPYACDSCDFRTARQQNLKAHKMNKHPARTRSVNLRADDMATGDQQGSSKSHTDSGRNRKKRYSCDLCEFKALTSDNLALHREIHNCEKQYACDMCDFKSLQLEDLRVHEAENHTDEEPYYCDSCGYKTVSVEDLKRHVRFHTGEEPCDSGSDDARENMELKRPKKRRTNNFRSRQKRYGCDICEFRASTPCDLSRHQRIHTGEKPYACHLCDYKSARLQNLKVHEMSHTGKKPYSCDKCDYGTFRLKNLLAHKTNHATLYCCDNCEYRTACRRDLLRHMKKIHCDLECSSSCDDDPYPPQAGLTDDPRPVFLKTYSCDSCEFRAATMSNLRSHLLTHSADKPYCCDSCNFRTSRRHNLKVHKARYHTGKKPFGCDSCDYRSARLYNLKTHMIKKHANE